MRHTYVAPLSNQDRLRVDFETQRGRVTALHVVQYETIRHGAWHAVARYDTAHGFVHLDLHTQFGQVKYQVPIQDLGDALTFAINDLKDNWTVYKNQFLGPQP
ncbi:MAG: hypothetical protein HY726_09480 [Candidatus Rokubacteria bacterium]|nr:hypothetical protein [Candidatus Rokubacteria bacterium]